MISIRHLFCNSSIIAGNSDNEGDLIHDDIHTSFVLQFINHRWELCILDQTLVWLEDGENICFNGFWPLVPQIPDWSHEDRLNLQELKLSLLELTGITYESWGPKYMEHHRKVLQEMWNKNPGGSYIQHGS